MTRFVRISNPAPGQNPTIFRSIANRQVRRGLARRIDDNTIERLTHAPAAHQLAAWQLAQHAEYDRAAHSGIAARDSLRHLPMVGNLELLYYRGLAT